MRVLAGSAAGAVATAPMTALMAGAFRALPREARRPLPPRVITMNVAEATGADALLPRDEQRLAATLAGHFGYGAATGAIYGLVEPRLPGPPVAKGILFGLGVWTASYLGWLPVAGLHPSATREPLSRNALMIGAHVVFGAALGLALAALDARSGGRGSRS